MTKQVMVGNVKIGGNAPISIQSMCNTPTKDAKATISQIKELQAAGCEIVRVAIPDLESANVLKEIKENISIPLVADIHFDYKLALAAAPYVDKLRINPGNIGDESKVREVVEAAKKYNLPIRIGINLGSLEKEAEAKHGRTAKAMVESERKHIELLEKNDFNNIIVSLKASDIATTIEACRLFAKEFDYPQHLGITEAGTVESGSIKSAIGLGILLNEGIGNTIRISLSGNPVEEVKTAYLILRHLGLKKGLSITSWPTCARTTLDVAKYAKEVETKLGNLDSSKHVAIMGCVVNGPGEAKAADIAIVGAGDKDPLLYIKGKFVKNIKKEDIVKTIEENLRWK